MFKRSKLALYLCLLAFITGMTWVNHPANDRLMGFVDDLLSLSALQTDALAQKGPGTGNEPGSPERQTKTETGLLRNQAGTPALPVIPNPAVISNGDFESGPVIWEEYSTHGWPLIIDSGFPGTVTPHSGSWATWLGGEYDDISYISQTITLPNADASFFDDFNSSVLDPRWSWVREDPSHWSLTANPGYLRIITQTGGVYSTSNNQNNLLLTPAPSGDFIITTRVTFAPTQNFQFAALQVYQDDDNYIQLNRAYTGGQTLNFDREVGGVPSSLQINLTDTTLYLRLVRIGEQYTAYFSTTGSTWTNVGHYYASFSNPWIGVSAANNTAGISEIPADFDFFQLNSGPFLNYWRWIASADSCGYDYGGVIIDSTAVDVFNLCIATTNEGWVNEFLDLNEYRGQTVSLQFRAETDSSLNSNLFIDDVSLSLEQNRDLYLPLICNKYCNFAYSDNFSNPSSGWGVIDDSYRKLAYFAGEYQMLLKQANQSYLSTPDLVLPENYRIEADMRQVSTAKYSHGLVFGTRFSGNTYETYQFLIYTPTREYLVEKKDLSGEWTTLVDWTSNTLINVTGSNHLAVEREGNTIRLYIGGSLVKTLTDASFTGAGRDAGLRVYSGDGAPVDTRFDNFSATCLP